MATLAKELGEISHCSALLKRASRLGLDSVSDFVGLAVLRGCSHYAPAFPHFEKEIGFESISNEELVALLLLGSNEFEPIAVRCAAQLTGRCDAEKLAHIARRERFERALLYIATAGRDHDAANEEFWNKLIGLIGVQRPVTEGILPHWSRFVSQTGVTRYGEGDVRWLHCR
jgi:hypothetical protein